MGGSEDQYDAEFSWRGGDVFAASYNGREWLLSGLGSGILPSFSPAQVNHQSLATFDGNKNFTDLSGDVPEQKDQILYANAWNGKLWLIGGGYDYSGVLYSYNGSIFQDLTPQLRRMVTTFGSIQSIAWNGNYWLIGGMSFLAKYENNEFTDLTPELASSLGWTGWCCNSVNTIAWNDAEWMLGGGSPIAQLAEGTAWLASYSLNRFVNLSPNLGEAVTDAYESSVLTVASTGQSWTIGGYANDHAILYLYAASTFTPLFNLVNSFTYVNWVGAGALHVHATPPVNRLILDITPFPFLTRSDERVRVVSLSDPVLSSLGFR
jgi:hypothetical protein